jgi:hypothetical protein
MPVKMHQTGGLQNQQMIVIRHQSFEFHPLAH